MFSGTDNHDIFQSMNVFKNILYEKENKKQVALKEEHEL